MFAIYFDMDKLELRRQDEDLSVNGLGRKLSHDKQRTLYKRLLAYDGACTSVENARAILRWYGSEDCIEYANNHSKQMLLNA